MKLSIIVIILCIFLFSCNVNNKDINDANNKKDDVIYYHMDNNLLGIGLDDKEIMINLDDDINIILKAENLDDILYYDLIIKYKDETINIINYEDDIFKVSNKSGTFMIYRLENYYILHSFHGGLIDDSDILIIDNKGNIVVKHNNIMFAYPDIDYEKLSFSIIKQCSIESYNCDLTKEPFEIYNYIVQNDELVLIEK